MFFEIFDEKFSKKVIEKLKNETRKKHVIHVKSCTIIRSIRIVTLVVFNESYDAAACRTSRKGFQIKVFVNFETSLGNITWKHHLETQTYLEKLPTITINLETIFQHNLRISK